MATRILTYATGFRHGCLRTAIWGEHDGYKEAVDFRLAGQYTLLHPDGTAFHRHQRHQHPCPDQPSRGQQPTSPIEFRGSRSGQPNRTLHQWLNPLAFTPQLQGTAGNEGRNQIYGPVQRQIDFAIAKNFPIREAVQLQFRAEAFNLTNTPNFADPPTSIAAWTSPSSTQPSGVVNPASGAFGAITSTTLGTLPREYQFALKLSF